MSRPEYRKFRFEDIVLDQSKRCIWRNGEERHLRQKSFEVLVCLIERRETLVSKNDLFEAVWPDTAVTDDVLVQCIREIRRAIGDDSVNPRFIRTVPKGGYRFIAQVNEESDDFAAADAEQYPGITNGGGPAAKSEPEAIDKPASRPRRHLQFALFAAGLLIFTTVLYFAWPDSTRRPELPAPQIDGRKTVAVMFFDNQSKSVDYDWLREGLADMLSAGLSRSEKLTLLSRDQVRQLLERNGIGNQNISVETATSVSGQSRADFFISGSFAQIGNTIRLDVRLHDGKSGVLITTESLTVEKAEQLLSEIDLLSLKISRRLDAPPSDSRETASVMTNNLEAYRNYSIAVEKAHALQTAAAIELLQKAVELDPDFAMALARIGYAYAVTSGQPDKGKPYLEKAFQLSSRLSEKDRMNIAAWYAIALQDFPGAIKSYREIIKRFPFETEAYWRLARLLTGEESFDEATEAVKLGLAVDANSKDLYNALGNILSVQGKHEEAIGAHRRFVELAPTEPNAYDSLGLSYQWSGDYKKAIENYDRAVELDHDFGVAIIHRGNALFRMGRYNDAIAAYNRYLQVARDDAEKARADDSISFVFINKNDFKTAQQYSAKADEIRKVPHFNTYLIARGLGLPEKAQRIEKEFLDNMSYVDRGNRSTPRFDYYYRGEFALADDNLDQAIEILQQVSKHSPPFWNIHDFEDSLAAAYYKIGRYDEAIAEYTRILQLNPHYQLARYHLAEAYGAKGAREEARENYIQFLNEWSDADSDIPEIIKARQITSTP